MFNSAIQINKLNKKVTHNVVLFRSFEEKFYYRKGPMHINHLFLSMSVIVSEFLQRSLFINIHRLLQKNIYTLKITPNCKLVPFTWTCSNNLLCQALQNISKMKSCIFSKMGYPHITIGMLSPPLMKTWQTDELDEKVLFKILPDHLTSHHVLFLWGYLKDKVF